MNPLRALFLSLSRMPPALMLVIIVGLAVVVALMVNSKMSESETKLKDQQSQLQASMNRKATVVYATKDISEGATIGQDALEEKQVDEGKAPQDSLSSATMAVGRIAKYGIPTGQIVSGHDLAPIGVSVGFESKVKEGYRAVTFAVDNNSGVAGFVAPGSHVDVLATVGSADKVKAVPILSDVEVIAVGQMYQKTSAASGAVPASSVTVSVTPGDASKLIKGITAGHLYLTLRNDKDHGPVAVVDVTSLFDKPKEVSELPPPTGGSLPPPPMPGAPSALAPAAPPPPPLHEIEMWTGGKKDVLSVPKD